MINRLQLQVSEDRRKRGNPYAHIEYLEEFAANTPIQAEDALAHEITNSRKLLQDPYAHLQGDGEYSGLSFLASDTARQIKDGKPPSPVVEPESAVRLKTYTGDQIQALVNEIHMDIWRNRYDLWDGLVPEDPVELLDSERAFWLKGYDFSIEHALGEFREGNRVIEVAGYIDQSSKKVRVSPMFPPNVRTFTAAHELGHAVLHPTAVGVHRDRPIDGAPISRALIEMQADQFASRFLMPENLLQTRFIRQFGLAPFILNEETAFALFNEPLYKTEQKFGSRRYLSRFLAKTEHFNGKHVISLAEQFRVSIESMAIRLEELRLV